MAGSRVFSDREVRWIGGGIAVSGLVILGATIVGADHVQTFVNALGAVGQGGIAVALYFLARAQLRVAQEQLSHYVTTYRVAEQREKTQARVDEEVALRKLRDRVEQLAPTDDGQRALEQVQVIAEELERAHGRDERVRDDLRRIREMAERLASRRSALPDASRATKRRQIRAIIVRLVASLQVSEEDARSDATHA